MIGNNHIAQLIVKHLQQTITTDEEAVLQQWISEHNNHRTLFNQLTNDTSLQQKLIEFSESDTRIQDQVYEQLPELRRTIIPISIKRHWWRYAAAAAALLVISFGAFYLLQPSRTVETTPVVQTQQPTDTNIPPGGNKATLTLADGSVIDLDKAGNGMLSEQGASKVVKSRDGELKYEGPSTPLRIQHDVTYNTVSTPRGGQYQITLGDGTKVWLNAASTIKYPTSFTGKERRVEVTGECYMEVAKDKQKPFIVSILPLIGGTESGMIEVLGTHFNVNAYGDEQPIVATLLEGKIKVASTANENNKQQTTNPKLILPGEQAQIDRKHEIIIKRNIDTDAAVAWMKGFFDFHDADIKHVMKQVSRWYNVEISYTGNLPAQTFEGNIDRNIPLNELLGLLQQMGKVKFKIEGRTVKVM